MDRREWIRIRNGVEFLESFFNFADVESMLERAALDISNENKAFYKGISADGVEIEWNTACNCHPEYDTETISFSKISDWLDKRYHEEMKEREEVNV